MLAGLEVRPERMRENFDITQDLIVTEAVMRPGKRISPGLSQVGERVITGNARLKMQPTA